MLRIHCVQLFYNLSDPGMEDMLYEVESVRRFVGLRLSGPLPDETTILNFRHLLEERELGQGLFEEINHHLESQGLRLREGTIVDASIIEAPSSTKNLAGDRDPEMGQTKKGNEWHFGMKVHIGADAGTGVVHSVTTTRANVHDVTEAHRLLHGGEKRVWGDAGLKRSVYDGMEKVQTYEDHLAAFHDHIETPGVSPELAARAYAYHQEVRAYYGKPISSAEDYRAGTAISKRSEGRRLQGIEDRKSLWQRLGSGSYC